MEPAVALSGAASASAQRTTRGNYTFAGLVERVLQDADAHRLCFYARSQSAAVNGSERHRSKLHGECSAGGADDHDAAREPDGDGGQTATFAVVAAGQHR